jgi:Flp pilus assembly protein TadB
MGYKGHWEAPGALRAALGISSLFPAFGIRSAKADYARKFGAEPGRYASFALIFPIFPSLLLGLLLLATFSASPIISIPILYALLASALLFLPGLAFSRIRSEAESELPLLLRTLGMLLELELPFTSALERLSKDDFAVSPLLAEAVREAGRGATLESALASAAGELESPKLKRAVSQVISAYEGGGGAREILRISSEFAAIGRHKAREHSSRQALFSLLFIAVSAILPAVFLIFSFLGAAVFSYGSSPLYFSLAFLLGFPLLSASILYASSLLSPPNPLGRKEQAGGRMLLPLLIAALSVLFPVLGLPLIYQVALLAVALALSVAYFYPEYSRQKRREEIEEALPDALLLLSGSAAGAGIDSAFSLMQKSRSGPLSDEISVSLKQLRAKVKPARALEDLWERNGSEALRRVASFFSQLFDSGASVQHYAGLMAEDLFCLFEERRVRRDSLSMQKYTLVFGALILPVILGNSLSLVQGMSGISGSETALPPSAQSAVPAYLIIYSFLCSLFISDAESRPSSMLTYFASLSIASTILFYLFLGTLPA